jgi:hypothetical protein
LEIIHASQILTNIIRFWLLLSYLITTVFLLEMTNNFGAFI